jgi:acetyl-CoA/propionyl-CoA carboxylase biotin carboxyl carrier protein
VKVAEGDSVEAGQVLCIVEAMKMENEVAAHKSGVIEELVVTAGSAVTSGQAICAIRVP